MAISPVRKVPIPTVSALKTPIPSAGAQALKDAASRNQGDANTVHIASAPGSTQSAQDYINKTGGTDAYVANQQAKQAAAQASGDTSMLAKLQADSLRTGLSYAPKPVIPMSQEVSQGRARDYINNAASGQGGEAAYTQKQNEKMTNATNSGDTAMLDKLRADSLRTGLTYSVNQAAPTPVETPVQQTQQPTQLQQLQQVQPQQSQSSGNADLINSMYDQNYASQLQKLKEVRDTQLQGLNGQETSANQNALQGLNNNDAMASQQMKQLQEIMANNGVRGGDNITASIGNQTAQQQGANAINQTKANQLQNISEQRSLINNNASAQDMSLMQQLQAARSGQQIDNNNTQDQRALQIGQLMGSFNGQQTLASRAQDQNYGLGLAGLTGNIGGQQTLAGQAQAYNQSATNPNNIGLGLNNQLSKLKLDAYPAESKAAAEEVQQKLAAGQITNQEAQLKLNQLKDPNSITNQKLKADMELTKSQSEYYRDHGSYYASGGGKSGSSGGSGAVNTYTGTVYDKLSQLDPADHKAYLEANVADIVHNIGQKAYDALVKSVTADQNTQGKVDTAKEKADIAKTKEAQAQKDRVIAAAQKDPDWKYATADERKAIIKQYEGYHQ